MLYAGLDLSRKRLDVHILDEDGRTVEVTAVSPDAAGLRRLAAHVLHFGYEAYGAIESMTGARFVHDTLERYGWDVAIADAAKVKGIAPLAAKTDRIDARVLAELARRELVPSRKQPIRELQLGTDVYTSVWNMVEWLSDPSTGQPSGETQSGPDPGSPAGGPADAPYAQVTGLGGPTRGGTGPSAVHSVPRCPPAR